MARRGREALQGNSAIDVASLSLARLAVVPAVGDLRQARQTNLLVLLEVVAEGVRGDQQGVGDVSAPQPRADRITALVRPGLRLSRVPRYAVRSSARRLELNIGTVISQMQAVARDF